MEKGPSFGNLPVAFQISRPNTMSHDLRCSSLPMWQHQNICSQFHSEKINLSTSTQFPFPKIYLYFYFYESNLRALAPWKWPCSSNCLSTPRVWLKPVEHAVASRLSPCNLKLPLGSETNSTPARHYFLLFSFFSFFFALINLLLNLDTVKLTLFGVQFCEFGHMPKVM